MQKNLPQLFKIVDNIPRHGYFKLADRHRPGRLAAVVFRARFRSDEKRQITTQLFVHFLQPKLRESQY